MDIDAGDHAAATREKRGQVSASGADLQRRLVRLEVELLQYPRFHFRRPHPFAFADRDFKIRKRERAIGERDEVFAPHLEQQVEYLLVKNLPGAYLLLHHIETCLLEVHPCLVITRNFSDLRGPIPSLRKLGARLGYAPRRSAS